MNMEVAPTGNESPPPPRKSRPAVRGLIGVPLALSGLVLAYMVANPPNRDPFRDLELKPKFSMASTCVGKHIALASQRRIWKKDAAAAGLLPRDA